MLITKIVKMKWNGRNKKYFIEKGYTFTKINDIFECKTDDLMDGSKARIDAQCDKCDIVLKNIVWDDYKKHLHEGNTYYCRKCATELFARAKIVKTKLDRGKSFEQWCLESNRKDLLDRWDYELNSKKPSEVTYRTTKKIYYFKCPRGIHQSEIKILGHVVSGDRTSECTKCNSFAQYLIDNYGKNALFLYWDYKRNNVDPWSLTYSCAKKVWIKCQNKDYHESYLTYCNSFVKGDRCPYCASKKGKIHHLDSLGSVLPESLKVWSTKNKLSPFDYTPYSSEKVWWKCIDGKHEDFFRDINNSNVYNFRCPECSRERKESFLQEKVRNYLESLGYIILHEYQCTILPQSPKIKDKRGRLPFDNEIKELKLIIEVNGSQHYNNASGTWFYKEFDLHKRQLYDRYKRIYAKSRGYHYLEIPYWTDNAKDEWKQLIDNKIKELI